MQRRLRQFVAPSLGALILVACETSNLVGPNEFRKLGEAEAKWQSRSFADYSYEIQILCFCPPEMSQWTHVTVRGGVVTAAEAVAPNPAYPITTIQWWDPIDSLFVDLRRTITDHTSRTYLESVIVEYDSELGYPTSIEYRAKATVADGGSHFLLRNVQPLD